MPRMPLVAFIALMPGAALAQDAVSVDPAELDATEVAPETMPAAGPYIEADDVQDARVYTIGDAYDSSFWDSGQPLGPIAADWGDIGEVEDLLIDNQGAVIGVTVEVGGFLGLGEKTVLIPLEDMRLVQRPDDDDDFYVVTRMSAEQLEEAEEIENVVGDD
ncbi:PRC-barrel domain-containing protein [Wenxinia saemankumensis]|uniref:PRC-barrel domain-containing protein n=1 Tax=Wenxinia saemankumensis TaxID=1447782 RepID=A0A1M6AVN2_9RHOB|nr:PRC-barrel domain-containing protein [Wenxinia saemankumensis]SHI40388.1 PRC-barrel domain-containing protein [Wenxinia saemankumensis]